MEAGEQTSHDHTTIAVKFPVHAALNRVNTDYSHGRMNDTVAWLLWYYDMTTRLDREPESAESLATEYVNKNIPPLQQYD